MKLLKNEIRHIQDFRRVTEINGSAEGVLATVMICSSFWNKLAVVIREIARGHLFNDANKRTTFIVVETLLARNNIRTGASSDQVQRIIGEVATGNLKSVFEIVQELKGIK